VNKSPAFAQVGENIEVQYQSGHGAVARRDKRSRFVVSGDQTSLETGR